MITTLLHLLRLFPFLCGGHRQLALENLALRQQLAVYKRSVTRPKLRTTDRLFWVGLARVWAGWRQSLVIVAPATVLRWQRRRFREHWTKLSGRPTRGRPPISPEIAALVTRMTAANPLGRSANPWRAAEARRNGFASDGFEVHGPPPLAAVAGVAHVFEESCEGSNRVGFLHRADGDVSSPVCPRDADPQPAAVGAFQCDG